MTATEILKRQRTTPFFPYRIHLADGGSFRIPQPDFLAVSPTGRTATAYTEDGEVHIIDIFLVTHLSVESPKEAEPPTPAGGAVER